MANLTLSHIYKVYSNGTKAVNDFTMDIDDKEFIVFVGPSGCGKSTTLRMIAGLEEISSGELKIGDRIVNNVEPKARDIAMVFQNYALYPHMTVYENMAFGLQIKKTPKAEIDERVRSAAEILGITEYLQKKPREMSGGQRQRVALGRALVREPKVFLLDEPLSNLDAKLRTQMRSEISKLHKKLQTTFIYVTHDQVEAMTMGTRIVVMKKGFIQQIDSPRDLYNFPVNKFVAGFIGTPQMNFFNGTMKLDGNEVVIKVDNTDIEFRAPRNYFAKADRLYLDGKKKICMGLRAEYISTDAKKFPFTAKCRVSYSEDLGIDTQVYADFNLSEKSSVRDSVDSVKVVVKSPAGSFYDGGEIIEVSLDLEHLHLFDAETEESIAPRIPLKTAVCGKVANGKLSMLGGEFNLPPAIALDDGVYDVIIPKDAVLSSGRIKVVKELEESVKGEKLVTLACGTDKLFVIANEGNCPSSIDIDLKLCTFMKDGEIAHSALNTDNVLFGSLTYTKKPSKNDTRKVKFPRKYDYEYFYDMARSTFACDQEKAKYVVAGLGKKSFSEKLVYHFSPYAATISEKGISADVEKLLDYETELFAVCKIALNEDKIVNAKEGQTVLPEYAYLTVAVNKDFSATKVHLEIDTDKVSVYGATHDIRLV